MAKRIGFGDYQYEVVEHWPMVAIRGALADVCVDARGRVYAGVRNPQADGSVSNILGGVGHVLILDRDGYEVSSWGNMASSPHGIWVNPADEIYLADTGFHTITKHAPTGVLLLALGTQGTPGPDGQPFNMPTHAVEAPNGDIFVSDGYGQNRIHRFSARGEHLLTFGGGDAVFIPRRFNLGPITGRPGTDPCQFNVPHDMIGATLWPVPRCHNDEELLACAQKGGLIAITAVPNSLSDDPAQDINCVLDHYDYMVKLVGIDHVGIGTDTSVGNHVAFTGSSWVGSRNSCRRPTLMAWSPPRMARTSSVV